MVAIYTTDQAIRRWTCSSGPQPRGSPRRAGDGVAGLEQDSAVLTDVTRFRAPRRARARLRHAVTVRPNSLPSAPPQGVDRGKLSERQQMLSSIKSEIAAIGRPAAATGAARTRGTHAQPRPLSDWRGSLRRRHPRSRRCSRRLRPQYGGVVGIAMQYLGIPYVYGGSSPSGFDCSGFVMYVYSKVGVVAAQRGRTVRLRTPVDRSQLQPGDLVFSTGSVTTASTSAAGRSSTRRTRATWSRSPVSGWYDSTWSAPPL